MPRGRWRVNAGRLLTVALVAAVTVAQLTGGVGRGGTGGSAAGHPRARVPQRTAAPTRHPPQLADTVRIRVRALSQFPELPYGCEVTSLAMLLAWAGHPVSNTVLAGEIARDPTPPVLRAIPGFHGNPLMEVTRWGNPNEGFVGSMTGRNGALGYGVYHGPVVRLLRRILPGRAEDLTGAAWTRILSVVAGGTPVVVWTTITFQPTREWVTWQSPEGPVTATPLEHAVLVVGYTPTSILINNPYNGEALEPVARGPFVAAWKQLGAQAVTVRMPAPEPRQPHHRTGRRSRP
jgi:uncharacterized protein YvpB